MTQQFVRLLCVATCAAVQEPPDPHCGCGAGAGAGVGVGTGAGAGAGAGAGVGVGVVLGFGAGVDDGAGAVGAGVAGFASGASVAASSLVPASSTTFPSASFTVTLPSASSEMIAPSISSPFLSIATISPVELPPKYLDEMSSNTDAGANIPATSITAVAAEVVISDPATSFFTIMTLRTLPYVFYYFLRPFCVIVSALISS